MAAQILQGSCFNLIPLGFLLIAEKGLGTSKDEDARDYFSHMNKHMIPFSTVKEEERELIDLAFSKKKADERKEWLRQLKVC